MAEEYELSERHQSDRMPLEGPTADAEDSDGIVSHDHDEDDTEQGLRSETTTSLDRRVVRKLDFLLLPFLSLFFLINHLDKSNLGNAETAGFTEDTGLQPEDVNTAIAWFFAFFVALQPVGAALGRYFGMRRWVPSVMILWGFLTTLHVWITAKWQLIAIRICIGCLEAGFYPVTVSYMSLLYTRYEFAKRLGIFYGQAAVAGALGGVIAYTIFSRFPADEVDESSTWRPWQVLFLVEGVMTIIPAIIGYLWLPDSAETAWFLSAEEKQWAKTRIQVDRSQIQPRVSSSRKANEYEGEEHDVDQQDHLEDHSLLDHHQRSSRKASNPTPSSINSSFTTSQGLSTSDMISAFTDPKVYTLLLLNILSAIPASAFSVFLPLIIRGLANGDPTLPSSIDSTVSTGSADSTLPPSIVNLLTAPPFLLGALTLWLFTYWSDRTRTRFTPILTGLSILILGLALVVLLPPAHTTLRYIALCLLLSGSFIASPLTIAWFTSNIPSPGKRAVVLGINGWGNLAGVVGSLLFDARWAPGYEIPFWGTLGCVGVAFVGFVGFRRWLVWENRRRAVVFGGWSEGMRERERVSGDGDGDGALRKRRSPLVRRLLGWFGMGDEVEGRKGEERLTFVYGL